MFFFILFLGDESGLNTSCFSQLNEGHMLSFDSNNSEKSIESIPRIRPEIAQQVEKILMNGLKHNQPLTCIESSVKILNQAPGVKYQLPESKYKIKQSIEPTFEYEMYYFCKKCQLHSCFARKQVIKCSLVCTHCGNSIKKEPNNFFIYIPLRQQLEASITKYWDSIFRFQNSYEKDENYICDVRDGSICKQIDLEFSNFEHGWCTKVQIIEKWTMADTNNSKLFAPPTAIYLFKYYGGRPSFRQ